MNNDDIILIKIMDRIKLIGQPSQKTSIVLEDEQDSVNNNEEVKDESQVVKKQRGGRRPGAGRRKKVITDGDEDIPPSITNKTRGRGSRKRVADDSK